MEENKTAEAFDEKWKREMLKNHSPEKILDYFIIVSKRNIESEEQLTQQQSANAELKKQNEELKQTCNEYSGFVRSQTDKIAELENNLATIVGSSLELAKESEGITDSLLDKNGEIAELKNQLRNVLKSNKVEIDNATKRSDEIVIKANNDYYKWQKEKHDLTFRLDVILEFIPVVVAELEAAYKRLGYSNSNILDQLKKFQNTPPKN